MILPASAWAHIAHRHADVSPFEEEVLATVEWPDAITPDGKLGRWRYWRRGVGPSQWLFVVVGWSTVPAQIITAIGKDKDPI